MEKGQAQQEVTHEGLKGIGVPQDLIDAAKQVEMDAITLGNLLIKHTEDAVRDFLDWAKSKLPGRS